MASITKSHNHQVGTDLSFTLYCNGTGTSGIILYFEDLIIAINSYIIAKGGKVSIWERINKIFETFRDGWGAGV